MPPPVVVTLTFKDAPLPRVSRTAMVVLPAATAVTVKVPAETGVTVTTLAAALTAVNEPLYPVSLATNVSCCPAFVNASEAGAKITRPGVVVGDGDGDGDAVGEGDGEGECVGLGDGDGVGECVGLGDGEGDGECVGLGDGDGDGECVGLGLGEGDCVGVGVGEAPVTRTVPA
jgi:hypothetical protein